MSSPKQPVRINFQEAKFKGASGKTYHIVDTLPIDYWIEYQKHVPELAFGTDFKGMHDALSDAYKKLTSGNEVMKGIREAGDILYNQLHAIAKFATRDRIHPALMMSCCWCIREDEDFKTFDPKLAKEKIEDWREAGIAIEDFFLLCSVKIARFREIYDVYRLENASKLTETPPNNGDSNTTSKASKQGSSGTS